MTKLAGSDPNPDPLVRGMDPRIRIPTQMSWIRNTWFYLALVGSAVAAVLRNLGNRLQRLVTPFYYLHNYRNIIKGIKQMKSFRKCKKNFFIVLQVMILITSVSDPHWFPDPDPAFYLKADPDPDSDPGRQTNADPC
jgi:hypothetical protein